MSVYFYSREMSSEKKITTPVLLPFGASDRAKANAHAGRQRLRGREEHAEVKGGEEWRNVRNLWGSLAREKKFSVACLRESRTEE
jgi:hypothetical protein